ncbi:MAG: hypothetical protein FJ110_18630 [Deltaproteobacteria bacterium]|nr:hypothetical protein [Deltaproteobacteria bacterium]
MSIEEKIKLFGMSHQMMERDLDRVEKTHSLDLQRELSQQPDLDETYYPQFDQAVRKEAAGMAIHYQLFYCLEKSIRQLVKGKLEAEHGSNWWNKTVPEEIRKNASDNLQKEIDSGVTPRSTDELDYATFGELGEIVRANWTTFSDTFNSQKAFTKIMASLNVLRGPIAHCSPLAPDEVVRLQITLRDWFRLME